MPTVGQAGWRMCPTGASPTELRLEQHRRELKGFCRRMLGSSEADDAVQETLLRAWRRVDRFEGRATLRCWLYRIATNVCLDIVKSRQRDARGIEVMRSNLALGHVTHGRRPATAGTAMPAGRVGTEPADPGETAVMHEAVRLAFAVLMRLPPRQRAVLIMREVLRWRADEVARFLGTTVASVNGSLQRARSTLAAREPGPLDQYVPGDRDEELVDRCLDAFERLDLDALTTLLRDEVDRSPGPSAKALSHAA
jgi:RNA polymerase sigma-70 factor, ECF subfamily